MERRVFTGLGGREEREGREGEGREEGCKGLDFGGRKSWRKVCPFSLHWLRASLLTAFWLAKKFYSLPLVFLPLFSESFPCRLEANWLQCRVQAHVKGPFC
ncbi:hypothetical protein VTK73DRAFT_8087 [Phialemonium thermophilum]|uniref:Uncharacterized protein n=1 Tax=Phialemonium thermophilum TaxID=223376 RepID=A0ABR3WAU7_9PEZI